VTRTRGLNSGAGKADHHVMDLRGNSQRTRRPVLMMTVGVAAVDVYDVGVDQTTTPEIHEKTTQEDRWTGQNDHHVTDLRDDQRIRPQVLERPRTQMDQRLMMMMTWKDVVVDVVVDLDVVERRGVEELVSDTWTSVRRCRHSSFMCDFTKHAAAYFRFFSVCVHSGANSL